MNDDLYDAPKPFNGAPKELNVEGNVIKISCNIADFYGATSGKTPEEFCAGIIRGFSHDGTVSDGLKRMQKKGKDDSYLEKIMASENERIINN